LPINPPLPAPPIRLGWRQQEPAERAQIGRDG
jgi:hypothetical protein